MPGKAETSAPGSFWGGRGNCLALLEPMSPRGQGPAGRGWSAPAKAQGPCPSPSSCCESGGFLHRAFINSNVSSTYFSAQTRLVYPVLDCLPCSYGSHIGFVQRAVLSPRQLLKWLPVPMSRSIRPALQNTDPVMEELSSLGGTCPRAAADAGLAAARARGKKGSDASESQICWPVSQQAVA